MIWDLGFVIYLEIGTCDLEIVLKLEIGNWKLINLYIGLIPRIVKNGN